MPHYTITLPVSLADKLQADAVKSKTPRSTLIAQHLEQYYSAVPAVELETRIQSQAKNYAAKIQELEKALEEHIATMQRAKLVIRGLQSELETAKTEARNLVERLANNTATINELQADKEFFKKQLELVTLRLPAPRASFWGRFRRKKE